MTVWRSWFWNIFLAVMMAGMAGIMTAIALTERAIVAAALFGAAAVVFWVAVIRAFTLGVVARADGLVARELMKTRVIPWADVEDVVMTGQTSGVAGALGVGAPAVLVRRADSSEPEVVELAALGSYGLNPFRRSAGRRAVDGLNAQLAAWRQRQGQVKGDRAVSRILGRF